MSVMELTGAQRRHLRALAHSKKVVVTLGQRGLTPQVTAEVEAALAHHELIKIRLPAAAPPERRALAARIAEAAGGAVVQLIGRVAVLYRPAETPRIRLPR